MPNEFVARNGIISLNNSQITGSLSVTQGVTASLFGTSSWATQALTSSYILQAASSSFATTASYALTASFINPLSQSVVITGSLNSVPINSYVLAASGGFSKSFSIINNSNISATDVGTFPVWRCNVPCTASMVLGYTDSGSAVLVNATKNGSTLLSSDLSISTNTWVSSSTLQNQNFNTGDILAFRLVSFSSTPKEITIQTSFNY